MPPASAAARRRRLGDLLVEAGLLNEAQLKSALAEQKKWGGRFGRTVVELGFTTEETMVKVLAGQLSLPTVDLDSAVLPPRIVEHLRLDLAERYGVFPLQIDHTQRTLNVATSDPTNVEAMRELQVATQLKILATVATASSIDRAIRRYYFGEQTTATPAATPQDLGVDETSYELDELLGQVPPRQPAPEPSPVRPAATDIELALRREIAVLREKVDTLETVNAGQVRALRGLLELLIESGLISREEYVQKLHRPE